MDDAIFFALILALALATAALVPFLERLRRRP